LDALARSIGDDQQTVVSLVSEIADMALEDGVEFRTDTAASRIIREQAVYSGVRIATDTAISTATVTFRIEVNFGDPITPALGWVTLPPLRAGMEPIRVLGYPIETVLAEKSRRRSNSDPANTRVRDYADIYALTGIHAINHRTARQALLPTAAHRAISVTIRRCRRLRRAPAPDMRRLPDRARQPRPAASGRP
jgi:nucleotidyltransferase AbiEii toxin of type IV toxin-antitoxin system